MKVRHKRAGRSLVSCECCLKVGSSIGTYLVGGNVGKVSEAVGIGNAKPLRIDGTSVRARGYSSVPRAR